MSEKFSCLKCGACCNTYWIYLLPSEAEKMSVKLNLSLKKFLSKYCVLALNFFPVEQKGKLTLSVNDLSKKLSKSLIKSPKYFVLPLIVLKRDKTKCIFLDSKNNCSIYNERPLQCTLFPVIGLQKKEVNELDYKFCASLKKSSFAIDNELNQKYYSAFKTYGDAVKEKGFFKIWQESDLPENSICLQKNEFISKISFTQAIKLIKKLN